MKTPTAAAQLGFAGLAPFAISAVAALVAPPIWSAVAQLCLILYGGLILSFMGGCRWGFAAAGLGGGPSVGALGLSVLPALWAFAVLAAALAPFGPAGSLLPFEWTCFALIAGFVALWASDRAASRRGDAPAWWPSLRGPLTLGACVSLGLGAAAGL